MNERSVRILAQDLYRDNDTRVTGNNNNDLIIGPSGSGKTRGYVIPNLLQANESMIVADTKGDLCRQFRPYLEARGYRVAELDFADMANSSWGYNPLALLRREPSGEGWDQRDIIALSAQVIPVETLRDPFWEQAAQIYLQALVGYVLECLPEEEHNLVCVRRLSQCLGTPTLDQMFRELSELDPDSFAVARYQSMRSTRVAEKTDASIRAFLDKALLPLSCAPAGRLYTNRRQLCLEGVGTEKSAVFLTISDTDRSNDILINLFYTQAFQRLVALADRSPGSHLPVPVRFLLDDFATNTVIPHFDNLISVIRSRDISVSLVVQSLSQLEGLYGRAGSQTIINNCDNWLYLGGLDLQTAREISLRLDRTVQTVLNMSHQEAVLLTRGQAPCRCGKFRLESHPGYRAVVAEGRQPFRPKTERRPAYEREP